MGRRANVLQMVRDFINTIPSANKRMLRELYDIDFALSVTLLTRNKLKQICVEIINGIELKMSPHTFTFKQLLARYYRLNFLQKKQMERYIRMSKKHTSQWQCVLTRPLAETSITAYHHFMRNLTSLMNDVQRL